MTSEVVVTFTSADGKTETSVRYPVNDLADYQAGVANGQHAKILAECMPMMRNELGDGVRYVSIAVDGALQPDV
jgi:hypothetical protein